MKIHALGCWSTRLAKTRRHIIGKQAQRKPARGHCNAARATGFGLFRFGHNLLQVSGQRARARRALRDTGRIAVRFERERALIQRIMQCFAVGAGSVAEFLPGEAPFLPAQACMQRVQRKLQ